MLKHAFALFAWCKLDWKLLHSLHIFKLREILALQSETTWARLHCYSEQKTTVHSHGREKSPRNPALQALLIANANPNTKALPFQAQFIEISTNQCLTWYVDVYTYCCPTEKETRLSGFLTKNKMLREPINPSKERRRTLQKELWTKFSCMW